MTDPILLEIQMERDSALLARDAALTRAEREEDRRRKAEARVEELERPWQPSWMSCYAQEPGP